MTAREAQRQATRARILDTAIDLLIRRGYPALTTVAVQDAAGLSRGALLHHFPTVADLTKALVETLVHRNELAARAAADRLGPDTDPLDRALAALYESMTRPSAQAELELWAAARTDPELSTALERAERAAGRDLFRVVDDLFGPDIVAHPRYPTIRNLTITVLRGTVASRVLRTSETSVNTTLREWADIIRLLLADDATAGSEERPESAGRTANS
ncbi:TetR/AcrR family transcriptional regulator [Nocardia sp. NPDC058176]|uniref:TetR/AcrR family transcriptional regulator n=1 Tax=Nocardia sp. NPDC058176 TaxID=3346368 RepID=UPI0036DB54AC